jgi:death-on-curing protein
MHINGIELAADFDIDDAEAFMNRVATDADFAVGGIASRLAFYAVSSP